MAVKEALNNALKHSAATELHLGIHWDKPRLTVTVRDNGKGFDLKTIESGRNGLINMTQRLNELDGTCEIVSRPGEGCLVEFKIPLKRALRSAWSRGRKPVPSGPAKTAGRAAKTESPST